MKSAIFPLDARLILREALSQPSLHRGAVNVIKIIGRWSKHEGRRTGQFRTSNPLLSFCNTIKKISSFLSWYIFKVQSKFFHTRWIEYLYCKSKCFSRVSYIKKNSTGGIVRWERLKDTKDRLKGDLLRVCETMREEQNDRFEILTCWQWKQ